MSWWIRAYVGQKVVCVSSPSYWKSDRSLLAFLFGPRLRRGKVYMISRIFANERSPEGIYLDVAEMPPGLSYRPIVFQPVKRNRKSSEAGVRALKRLASQARKGARPAQPASASDAAVPAELKGGGQQG